MAKFTKLSFCQKLIFGIKLLHTNVQCVYIVYAKYQIVSAKAVLPAVNVPSYALSMHLQNASKITKGNNSNRN